MQIHSQTHVSGQAPVSEPKMPLPQTPAARSSEPETLPHDQAEITHHDGKALTTMPLVESEEKSVNLPPKLNPKSGPRLGAVSLGGSILNDSNFFVQNEDDLGMTTSYRAQMGFSFAHQDGSQSALLFDNRSALHSQFLGQANGVIDQSTVTTQDITVGYSHNGWLVKDPHFSFGGQIQYKGIDTNPHSGWANVQAALHDAGNLRQYHNQENPFVQDEAYLTPKLTAAYDKSHVMGKVYLQNEARVGMGPMIPLGSQAQFYTPVLAEAYSGLKFGYAYRDLPLIYAKVDGQISNEPLPYDRDHGTLGSLGFAVGNEIPLLRRDKLDANLHLETRFVQPFGHLGSGPLPDQVGKHDPIHEMFNVKLKLFLK